MTPIEVTHLYCPASDGKPGEDNTTHHLVPRAQGQTCRYCGKTEKQLAAEAKTAAGYTVVGVYVDDEPQVTGVIQGHHAVEGGEGGDYQPWAVWVQAPDVNAAEMAGLAAIAEENG